VTCICKYVFVKGEEELNNVQVEAISDLQESVYQQNLAAGWWTDLNTGKVKEKGNITEILAKLALVHSEVSEALEGARKGLMDDKLPNRPMIEVELADAIIRILDLCGHEGLDLAGAIQDKLLYNAHRSDHKMENRLKDGGKKA
jgi:NTP pyrophosphatase (non-canonical NTP hydrolase)